ncbi:MAG: hypothetical protein JWO46_1682 [Nocardioidaceae bacterium]|nr:hypothetical protein [Nocardioidaceae bacterium]
MDQTRTDVERELAERYGTHRPVRRGIGIAVVVVLGGIALGWLIWTMLVHSNPALQAEVASFDVRSEHRVDATVQMRVRDRYVRGTCLLRASAADHAIVGELSVSVADTQGSRERVYPVRTEREADTVEVIRCSED